MANGRGVCSLPASASKGRPGPERPSTAASKAAAPQEKRGSRAPAARKKYQRHGKPPYSYLALIALVIRGSPEKKLTLAQIIAEIDQLFSFEDRYQGWKESIRHNLSANACFFQERKDPTNPRSKGNFWRVDVDLIPPGALKLQNTPISRQKGAGLAPDLAPFILEGRPYAPPWCRATSQEAQPLASTEGGAKRSQTPPRPFTVQHLLQGSAEADPEGQPNADAPLSLAGGSARVPTMASPSAFTERPSPGLPAAFDPLPLPSHPPHPLGWQLPQGPLQGALACPVMAVPCPFMTSCPLGPPGSPFPFYPTCCSALPAPLFLSPDPPGVPGAQGAPLALATPLLLLPSSATWASFVNDCPVAWRGGL